jgi:hypothetical protein
MKMKKVKLLLAIILLSSGLYAQTATGKSNTLRVDIRAEDRGDGKMVTNAPFDDEKAGHVTEEMYNRRNYGLFIGVDQYRDDKINDLDKPVRDAKTLKR